MFAAKQICEAVEKTDTKDILRDHFKTLCLSYHALLDSDDFMDRLLNFVQLVVKVNLPSLTKINDHFSSLSIPQMFPNPGLSFRRNKATSVERERGEGGWR